MQYLRNRKSAKQLMISLSIRLFILSSLLGFQSGTAISTPMDSTHYDKYVRLKKAMTDMELWQGNTPKDLQRLDKELYAHWIKGNSTTALNLLDQALGMVESRKSWTITGTAACDNTAGYPDLLTVSITNDGIDVIPILTTLQLTTGIGKLYSITIINGTDLTQTISIDIPVLFRAGRQVEVPAGDTYELVWLVRSLEVYPHSAEVIATGNNGTSTATIQVIPTADKTKPLVGTAIHMPGYGRYDRKRFSGGRKPPPEEVKKHPERFRPVRFEEVPDDLQEEVRLHYSALQTAPSAIYRLAGDWDYLELQRDIYSWVHIDANIRDTRRLTKTLPVLYLGYQPWWIKETRNPSGKKGLKDINNPDLWHKYRQYIREVAEHTTGRIDMFEMWNEPIIYWFYDEKSLPTGHQYVSNYGDALLKAIEITAEELRKEQPNSWVISPGFGDMDMFSASWAMLKYQIDHGMLDKIDALCVHKYPLGVDAKSPPGDSFLPWMELDYLTDETQLVQLMQKNGKGDMPLWCTELGGFGNDWLDGLAYLRMGSILAHQGFTGLHYTSLPINLLPLEESITGATPVEWKSSKKINSNYEGVVVKTFTRGAEDVIILWNNSDNTQTISFTPAGNSPTPILLAQELSLPRKGSAHRDIIHTQKDLNAFYDRFFRLGPLEWKALLIIPQGNQGLRWLREIEGVGGSGQLSTVERHWQEAKHYQRDIFSGVVGSRNHQQTFKNNFKLFRKSMREREITKAQDRLEDLVEIGEQTGK